MGNDSSIEPQSERKAGTSAGKVPEDKSPAQALYQRIFELMPGSILLLSEQGMVLDANPAFCRQIGYGRQELLHRHVSLFSQDSRETIESNLARLLAGEVLEHDVINVSKDGSLRYYELRETAITLPEGGCGILALSNDITQRNRTEKEKLELQGHLLHAEKLKSLGLMAGGIAHDFNNMLTAIIGNIELGLLDLGEKSSAGGSFRDAIAVAKRAAHLTRQMLAYSGRGQFTVTDVDLNELISGTTELLKAAISRKASLEFRLAEGLPCVEGDAVQLQQVLMNLVTNASEALGDNPGLITITSSLGEYDATTLAAERSGNLLAPGRYVALEVSDTGCGMEESVQQRLFDPFFTTKFTGRGLGMSAVLGAVRGHNGGIIVSSTAGQGTTVSVLFPAGASRSLNTRQPAVAPPADRHAVWPVLTGTVLVADDEAIMRSMVERLLKRTGLRVLLAADGVEAVNLFKLHAHEITFVLFDLTTHKLDGAKTLAELRRVKPKVKAVLTSGSNAASCHQRSTQEGFVAFIPKPYDAANLIELARQICAGEL